MVVAHQHRAVLEHQEVHRPAQVGVVLDEAGHEGLDLRAALAVGPGHRDVGVLGGAVPGAVARDEHRAAVLGREHLSLIEGHAQRRGVWAQQRGGLGVVGAALAPAEFRIEDVALVAVRIAEVLVGLGHHVELVVGQVLGEPVAPVVGEPEVAGLRIEVEAHRVAHAARDGLDAAAVEVHAEDARMRVVGLAEVAGRADRVVELLVADAQVAPAVVLAAGQLVVEHHRLAGVVELVLDAVVALDLLVRREVERALVEFDAGGELGLVDDGLRLAVALLGNGIDLVADEQRAHEHRALGALAQRARIEHARGPGLDLEARRQLELCGGQLVGRSGDRKGRHGRQPRGRVVLGPALGPAGFLGGRLLGPGGAGREEQGGCKGREHR